MTWNTEFSRNRATEREIAVHLLQCDEDFATPLSSRVEIGEYARKISVAAMRFEAWSECSLIGLVAVYNNTNSGFAYITSVSVVPAFQGYGIATQLLEQCIGYLREGGLEYVELGVDTRATKVIRMYERFGFVTKERRTETVIMRLNLGWEGTIR